MTALAKSKSGLSVNVQVSERSMRLKKLSEGAQEIGQRLAKGEITEQQASEALIKLKREHSSFLERIFS